MSTITESFRKTWDQTSYAKTYSSSGVLTNNQTSVQTLVGTSQVTKEVARRRWRVLIAHGLSATTPLSGTKYDAECPFGDAGGVLTSTKDHKIMYGDIGRNLTGSSFPSPVTSLSSAADNKARSRLLSRYLEIRNTWRGGNFLAEIRETIHMIKHPLDSIYRRSWDYVGKLNRLRNVSKQRDFDLLKHLSDLWLSYIFGIKPLADDVSDGLTALRKVLGPYKRDTKFIKASATDRSGSVTHKEGENVGLYVFPVSFDTVKTTVSTVKYYGELRARPSQTEAAIEQFGVTPFDAIPAVWEAVPFSFVVDYFANVAEVLDGYRLCEADCMWMNQGVRNIVTSKQASVKLKPQASYGGTDYVNYSGSRREVRFVQRQGVEFPHPNFYFKMPGFPSLKWLNLTALFEQYNYAMKHLKK